MERVEDGKGRRQDGSVRREAIFAAALRLFREKGFHATSINDIGAAAGVTGPALYRHFGSKGDVLAEAIREGSRHVSRTSRAALAGQPTDPMEILHALARAYVEAAVGDADTHAAFVLEARHLPEKLRTPLRGNNRRYRDQWEQLLRVLRPEIGPQQAHTAVRMAQFAVVSLCLTPSRLERNELIDFATSLMMAMLLAPVVGPPL